MSNYMLEPVKLYTGTCKIKYWNMSNYILEPVKLYAGTCQIIHWNLSNYTLEPVPFRLELPGIDFLKVTLFNPLIFNYTIFN